MILVLGRNPRKRVTNTELKIAIPFMSKLIMSQKLMDKIEVEVKMTKKPLMKGFAESMIETIDEDEKIFKITIQDTKKSKAKILQCLAHELVHVKQIASGEWEDEINKVNGKLTTRFNKKLVDVNSTYYYDLPWEIEAHGREYGIWLRYRNWVKKKKIKF